MSVAIAERTEVLTALATVRDPELDEPITALGFVSATTVGPQGSVAVRLRLPTYFCAANFAYLMVADAYDAISALPWPGTVTVTLEDHFAADAINAGVAARAGFVGSFAGEAVDELDELRANFLRKAVLAGADQVCRPLLAAGLSGAALAGMSLGEVPESGALERLRHRRAELGLSSDDDAPLLVDPFTGAAVKGEESDSHLRRARTVRVGVEANTSICRGMLAQRYPARGDAQEER